MECQSKPASFISASQDRRQVFLGRPRLLLPGGFQRKACRVLFCSSFLRMWPIQSHFLFLTSMAGGSCLVRCHSSSFDIFSGHLMPRSLRRQPLTNDIHVYFLYKSANIYNYIKIVTKRPREISRSNNLQFTRQQKQKE